MPLSSTLAERVETLQHIIGYTFTNQALLFESLHSAGFYVPARSTRDGGHKDLAQVGDAVLRMVLILHGYQARKTRSTINNTISANASNANLAATGFDKTLDHFVMINPAQGRTVSNGVMASTVEALIGAVYIDSNMDIETVRSVIDTLDLGWPA
ncbi:ribonuclease III [Aspergillus sclerotiicarbonarius CBS 121057]|uniref:Ribonuclease III n=1 Tax=Aspergillus sclerotiicarbonarius (strain CBS 121057 / IBT 28362) TaxID=1448318 RepID=A0A319DZ74_ASPSB|nr:ribonuclease III [Aspergillus sclerotiicarbonarius CBS 121057]